MAFRVSGEGNTTGKSQHKTKAWCTVGSNIISSTGTAGYPISLVDSGKTKLGLDTTGKKDPRTPRPAFARGVGLTPRLFEYLMNTHPTPFEASASKYLPTVSRHVENVAPSKNVFAQYWCPVVVVDSVGARHVLHVDPLVVRAYRRTVADELQHVRDKRKRMLGRIQHIRQDFPQTQAQDIATRLKREIADAEEHANETLLPSLPESTSVLHVFLEVTPYMLQLESVCQRLAQELPEVLAAAGVQRISFSVLSSDRHGSNSNSRGVESLPTLAPFNCKDPEAWSSACDWLSTLRCPAPPGRSRKSNIPHSLHFAKALRWATASEAFEESCKTAVLLMACSQPADLEACVGLARRSNVSLQLVGIFGLAPDDPEPGLQQLADASAPGSSLRLFFGHTYWEQFIAAREQQLRVAEESLGHAGGSVDSADRFTGDSDVVSANVLEMRLIERVMRECYSEEQQCEEELTCATRVFERKLIDREDLLGILRANKVRALTTQTRAPYTAR